MTLNKLPKDLIFFRHLNSNKTVHLDRKTLTTINLMIEIITERTVWNNTISLSRHSDFYHTYFYHNLSKKENETPLLIKYEDDNSCILLPLLIREIENSVYKDATSVYGYSGMLCVSEMEHFDNENFKKELNAFLVANKIISVFSRLHPYLDFQEKILSGIGQISNPGDVVYINLLEPIQIQRQHYSNRLKTHVNKAKRLCTIIKGETKEQIHEFIKIYYENMRRVDAHERYFFDETYFYQLMASPDFEVELSLALNNNTNEIIAGALFIKTDNIVQYHLSGIKEEFLDINPIKLVIDSMRVKSTEEGYTYLNLGGGRENKQDSLFRFKTTFSKNLKPFKLWKHIVDEKVYQDLVNQQQRIEKDLNLENNQEFFPAYRCILTNL